ncbi:MAG TPA: hypothetical protein VLL47_03080 [Robiginitalea sp.]|nr:hypothetical protein [Robiginitalea sp.]
MSSDDKLQVARLIAFGLAIIIASLVWAYSGDLSDLLAQKTTQFLGDSYGRMGGIANR